MLLKRIVSSILLGGGLFYLYAFGLETLLVQLGWATGVVALWFVAVMGSFFARNYFKQYVNIIMFFSGVIVLNHTLWHLRLTGDEEIMYKAYAIVPAMLLYGCGFIGFIEHGVKKRPMATEEGKVLMNFKAAPFFLFMVGYYLGQIILNIFFLLEHSLVIGLCLWLLAYALYLGRMDAVQLQSLMRPMRRFQAPRGWHRIALVMVTAILIVSMGFEYHRGFWFLATLNMVFTVLASWCVYLLYRHVFTPEPEVTVPVTEVHVPNVWNKRFLIISAVFIGVILPICAILLRKILGMPRI